MMGAGVIGAAAIVTLAGLAKPIVGGLKSALEAARKAKPMAPYCRVRSRTSRSSSSAWSP
jgi:uncharacterized oligopeptide transporter (OPT) family protein